MEKQPDKMQIMFEWFLGEAKELTDSVQQLSGEIATNAAKVEEAAKAINAAVEAAQLETVAAQRELSATIKKAIKVNADLARQLENERIDTNRVVSRNTMIACVNLLATVLFIAACCAYLFLK